MKKFMDNEKYHYLLLLNARFGPTAGPWELLLDNLEHVLRILNWRSVERMNSFHGRPGFETGLHLPVLDQILDQFLPAT